MDNEFLKEPGLNPLSYNLYGNAKTFLDLSDLEVDRLRP